MTIYIRILPMSLQLNDLRTCIVQTTRKTNPQAGTGNHKMWVYIEEGTQKQQTTAPH